MKRMRCILSGMLILVAFACSKPESEIQGGKSSDNNIKNITAWAESADRGRDVLDVSYTPDGAGIHLISPALPTTAAPVDRTKVHLEVTVAVTASVNISSDNVIDLTEDRILTVTAENGDVRQWALHYVETPAYEQKPEFNVTFEPVWSRTGTELGLVHPETARGIAIAGDYLIVLDNMIDQDMGPEVKTKIKAFDKTTGDFVQDVTYYEGGWTTTSSYMWSIASDDAGNFAIGRLNSGGAGCRVDYYTGLDAVPVSLFGANEAPPASLVENLGKRMQIIGDITSGKSMILMTAGHYFGDVSAPGFYGVWELENGVPVNNMPQMIPTAYMWHSATVQRVSLEDPTVYVAYNDEAGYPNAPLDEWESLHAANFIIQAPGKTPVAMKQECMLYRMTDMKVFEMLGGRFLASLQQTYSTAGAMKTIVYDITDEHKMKDMLPSSEGYDKFKIYQSEGVTLVNNFRYGNVTVDADKDAGIAYIYTFIPKGTTPDGSAVVDATISCLKMTAVRTN